jgi:hypothetical protein
LALPLVFITLKYGKSHLYWVWEITLNERISLSNLLFFPNTLWKHHLTLPVLMFSLTSIFISIWRRDKNSIMFLMWIISLYLFLTVLGIQSNPRYAIYWIPAFCVFAAAPLNFFKNRTFKITFSILLVATVCYQFIIAYKLEPEYVDGYEQMAKYMAENLNERTILYSGVNDTGYLIFYIRKHDPNRRFIVLRSDKILATSSMKWIVEERIKTPEEIYQILEDFGIRYVVVEDTLSRSKAIELLRKVVKSNKFTVIKKITLLSNRERFNNIELIISEYKGYTPYKGGKILHMNIPLIQDSITIPFDEIHKKN